MPTSPIRFTAARPVQLDSSVLPDGLESGERRREPRLESSGLAKIQSLEIPGAQLIPSTIESTSESGLRLRTPFIFPPQHFVQIRLQDRIVSGKIQYCSAVENEFRLGISLCNPENGDADSRHSSRMRSLRWIFTKLHEK